MQLLDQQICDYMAFVLSSNLYMNTFSVFFSFFAYTFTFTPTCTSYIYICGGVCFPVNIFSLFSLLHFVLLLALFTLFPEVDKCSTNNGGCDHDCVDTNGYYECQCSSGYRLSSDDKSCTGEIIGPLITLRIF